MYQDGHSVAGSDRTPSGPKRGRRTILVIDDEEAILAMLGDFLEGEGYTVWLAENGHAGFERAVEVGPDLILTDLMMPVMDGRTLCHQLRAESRTARIPLIAMSAASRLHDGDGFDAVIAKPFDLLVLLKVIRAQLDGAQ